MHVFKAFESAARTDSRRPVPHHLRMPEPRHAHARQRAAIVGHQTRNHGFDERQAAIARSCVVTRENNTIFRGRTRCTVCDAGTFRQVGGPPPGLTNHIKDVENQIDLTDLALFQSAEFSEMDIEHTTRCGDAQPIVGERSRVVAGRAYPRTILEGAGNEDIVAPLNIGKCVEEGLPERLHYCPRTLMVVDRMRSMPLDIGVIKIA